MQSGKHPTIEERLRHQVTRVAAELNITEREAALSIAATVVRGHVAPNERLCLARDV